MATVLPDFDPPPDPQPGPPAAAPTPPAPKRRRRVAPALRALAQDHLDAIYADVTPEMLRGLLDCLTHDWQYVVQVRKRLAAEHGHSWYPAAKSEETQKRLVRKIMEVGLRQGHPIVTNEKGIKLGDLAAVQKCAARADTHSRGSARMRDLLLAVAAKMQP